MIPVDLDRCQALRRGGSFMTLGPRQLIRCTAVPTVIAREPQPPHGKMSLCDACRAICAQQVPGVTFTPIRRKTERCACGRPLHYPSKRARQLVETLIATQGPTVKVSSADGAWRVPRHYIALHGLAAPELPTLADQLGFEKV